MADPTRYRYRLILMTEKGQSCNITKLVEDLSWEEPEKELAARITFYAKDDETSLGRLASIAKPGCHIYVRYTYKGGKVREAVQGRIVEWERTKKASKERVKIKAYDCLYDLQESSDNIYFSAGVQTKTAITQILAVHGIPVGKYTGPDVTHGKLLYKNKKLSAIILEILDEAKKKGAKKGFLRGAGGKVNVLAYGDNDKVYAFEEKGHLLSASRRISTAGMVTRVKVVGEEDDEGRRPVEAVVDGQTKYGIRQKLVTRGTDESLDDAKKAAQDILDEDGDPDKTFTVKTVDIPSVRKGHMIHLKSSMGTGYFNVMGISHDCGDMTMQMDLKKTKGKGSSGKKGSGKDGDDEAGGDGDYQVGDIVDFHGGKHYISSYPGAQGYDVAPGKAKITENGGSGKAHPWHLVTQDWSQTHVYGWVDDGTFD